MKLISLKHLLIGLCMFAAAGMALALKPTAKLVDAESQINLETLVPAQFGDWKVDETIATLLVTPELQKLIEETYNQTLTRTYVNGAGKRIMLSVAYGGSHGEGMQTHRPEVCYPAQGFQVVKDTQPAVLSTKYGELPIKRLVAAQGARNEPITYWVVVGDQQTQFGLRMKLAQMRYTLTGVVPDGMLVRVSSIDRDEAGAYDNQTDFIRSMLASIRDTERERITGKFGS
ncbi:exosortase-associated protein EpsI, B-type [Sulfuriferula sp.]|uniref:exosortase-associated protein EpsI, B-type n=1 Tax=Sulfuriferula sp. TaxID=2025307 RepID=UPI00273093B9|nr:exosortase-associated protein EpsI, B-type [Sulfuriferula sp.]MDP2025564.1 EpsI family protein [Sulfuriferula sp.]